MQQCYALLTCEYTHPSESNKIHHILYPMYCGWMFRSNIQYNPCWEQGWKTWGQVLKMTMPYKTIPISLFSSNAQFWTKPWECIFSYIFSDAISEPCMIHTSFMQIEIKTNEYHSIITYVHIYEYIIYIYILYLNVRTNEHRTSK